MSLMPLGVRQEGQYIIFLNNGRPQLLLCHIHYEEHTSDHAIKLKISILIPLLIIIRD